jgi:hypothetical protein
LAGSARGEGPISFVHSDSAAATTAATALAKDKKIGKKSADKREKNIFDSLKKISTTTLSLLFGASACECKSC